MNADKMFEKLGYEFTNIDFSDFHRHEFTKKTKLKNGIREQCIWFDLINKEIYIHNSIKIDELQAINKKVEELGWIERN